MLNTRSAFLNFFWAGIAKHGQTGGIVPSQKILITKMIDPIPRTYNGSIIELGAGNGALTLRLAKKCPNANIFAYEINPTLAFDSRRNLIKAGLDKRVEVIADSAKNLISDMERRRLTGVDYIISGIPLGNLGRKQALDLLDTISYALKHEGLYIQFQHSLFDRQKIREKFSRMRTVPVLLNFPPAFVYYAQK
ncbi:methyltransferase [candidate division KSB1 bacterium]|nr:methyltransferase [candidate division KSB1 bacterium]